MRLFNVHTRELVCKYAGDAFLNTSSQIRGTFSPEGEYILIPSEDGSVAIYQNDTSRARKSLICSDRVVQAECFQAFSSDPCSAATFAPTCVQNLLISAGLRPIRNSVDDTLSQGQLILVASIAGKLRLFENNHNLPTWLDFNKEGELP